MDRFAASMVARGPTLDTDRETATGSLHVLALPSVDAAREFVALEPNNRAGVYREHEVWRFENLLGRSMWDFSGAATEPRFLVVGRSQLDRPAPAESPPSGGARAAHPVWGTHHTRWRRTGRSRTGSSGTGSRSGRFAHGRRADRACRVLRCGDPQLGVRRPALKTRGYPCTSAISASRDEFGPRARSDRETAPDSKGLDCVEDRRLHPCLARRRDRGPAPLLPRDR